MLELKNIFKSYEGKPLTSDVVAASMFTEGLVHGLSSGTADRDRDGLITVEDAFLTALAETPH